MSDDKKKLLMYGLTAVSLIISLIAAYFGIKLPYPGIPDAGSVSMATSPETHMRALRVDHDAAIGGDATVSGGMTVVGTLTTGGISSGTGTEWEGTTADAYETTLAITDPTDDRTVTVPNASGTVMLSSLATNAADAANSVTGASNALVFEGATANAYEMSVSPADPGADVTLTLPAETSAVMVSSLTTNATDAANSVTGASNGLVFEGATADAYETTVTPTDATADRTITAPNISGTMLLTNTPKIVAFGTNTITDTLTISHGIASPSQVFCTLTQDSEANAATCSATISSNTVVIKVWKADGATAGSVGKQVAWMVVGSAAQ